MPTALLAVFQALLAALLVAGAPIEAEAASRQERGQSAHRTANTCLAVDEAEKLVAGEARVPDRKDGGAGDAPAPCRNGTAAAPAILPSLDSIAVAFAFTGRSPRASPATGPPLI